MYLVSSGSNHPIVQNSKHQDLLKVQGLDYMAHVGIVTCAQMLYLLLALKIRIWKYSFQYSKSSRSKSTSLVHC